MGRRSVFLSLQWRGPHGLSGLTGLALGTWLILQALAGDVSLVATFVLPLFAAVMLVNSLAGLTIISRAPQNTRPVFKACAAFQTCLLYFVLRFSPIFPGGGTAIVALLDGCFSGLAILGIASFALTAVLHAPPPVGVAILGGTVPLMLLVGYPLQLAILGQEWWECVQESYDTQARAVRACARKASLRSCRTMPHHAAPRPTFYRCARKPRHPSATTYTVTVSRWSCVHACIRALPMFPMLAGPDGGVHLHSDGVGVLCDPVRRHAMESQAHLRRDDGWRFCGVGRCYPGEPSPDVHKAHAISCQNLKPTPNPIPNPIPIPTPKPISHPPSASQVSTVLMQEVHYPEPASTQKLWLPCPSPAHGSWSEWAVVNLDTSALARSVLLAINAR